MTQEAPPKTDVVSSGDVQSPPPGAPDPAPSPEASDVAPADAGAEAPQTAEAPVEEKLPEPATTKEAFEEAQTDVTEDAAGDDLPKQIEMLTGLVEMLGRELEHTNARVDELEKRISAVARNVADVR